MTHHVSFHLCANQPAPWLSWTVRPCQGVPMSNTGQVKSPTVSLIDCWTQPLPAHHFHFSLWVFSCCFYRERKRAHSAEEPTLRRKAQLAVRSSASPWQFPSFPILLLRASDPLLAPTMVPSGQQAVGRSQDRIVLPAVPASAPLCSTGATCCRGLLTRHTAPPQPHPPCAGTNQGKKGIENVTRVAH